MGNSCGCHADAVDGLAAESPENPRAPSQKPDDEAIVPAPRMTCSPTTAKPPSPRRKRRMSIPSEFRSVASRGEFLIDHQATTSVIEVTADTEFTRGAAAEFEGWMSRIQRPEGTSPLAPYRGRSSLPAQPTSQVPRSGDNWLKAGADVMKSTRRRFTVVTTQGAPDHSHSPAQSHRTSTSTTATTSTLMSMGSLRSPAAPSLANRLARPPSFAESPFASSPQEMPPAEQLPRLQSNATLLASLS